MRFTTILNNLTRSIMEKYKNKKTGELYYRFESAINTTNDNDGQILILYVAVKDCGIPGSKKVFAREETEFFGKFVIQE